MSEFVEVCVAGDISSACLMMNRRTFLQSIGLGAAAAFLPEPGRTALAGGLRQYVEIRIFRARDLIPGLKTGLCRRMVQNP